MLVFFIPESWKNWCHLKFDKLITIYLVCEWSQLLFYNNFFNKYYAYRTSLLWLRYLYMSILFLGAKLLFSVSILFFFWVQNFYALFILIWDAFLLFFFFYFFRFFVFVFILFEHPWHAIDVFVRLCECPFKKSYNFTNKKIFYFTLVYLEISQVSFLKCVVAYWKNVRL